MKSLQGCWSRDKSLLFRAVFSLLDSDPRHGETLEVLRCFMMGLGPGFWDNIRGLGDNIRGLGDNIWGLGVGIRIWSITPNSNQQASRLCLGGSRLVCGGTWGFSI